MRTTYNEAKIYLEGRKGINGSKLEISDDEIYRYMDYMNDEF